MLVGKLVMMKKEDIGIQQFSIQISGTWKIGCKKMRYKNQILGPKNEKLRIQKKADTESVRGFNQRGGYIILKY